MFFRDLKLKKGTLDITLANVHLPVKLGHRDADKLFAAPLKAQLAAAALGTVLECKRRVRPSGQVQGVDMHLGLTDISHSAFRTVIGMLEALAAPCGSSIRLVEGLGDPIVFGRTEGLELSIETTITPDAEARRDLAMTCREAIEAIGVSRGWDVSDALTHFYFYGENFAEMKQRLNRILAEHPRYGDAMLRRVA